MSAALADIKPIGSAVAQLQALVNAPERFDIPHAELLPTQLRAADELFQDRLGKIRLLQNRAESGGIKAIRSTADIVPLLFAHTAYKSYPEAWLADRKWDRLCKWLDTVSTHRVKPVDSTRVRDIDDWIDQLATAGHFVSCSSGTTGKSAMLIASAADLAWSAQDSVYAYSWGANVQPARDRRMFGLAPVASVPRNLAIRDAMASAFGDPGSKPFIYPVPPITIGKITGMVTLRKRIADGTARPGEIAEFEATSATRQQAIDAAAQTSAEALVDARRHKLALSGMWAALYRVAELVRGMGYSGKDFHSGNTIYIGGGLKGASLPANYREYVFETFNLAPEHVMQMYGMQEIGSAMPRCRSGRYHVPPWLMCLLLDEGGDRLLPVSGGELEGRAAFFDISLDGRWNGVISGDKIAVDYGRCACGRGSPSIRDNITRYADSAGGDKINCSGTIDAYVRGVS
jgi:hypothetical protein